MLFHTQRYFTNVAQTKIAYCVRQFCMDKFAYLQCFMCALTNKNTSETHSDRQEDEWWHTFDMPMPTYIRDVHYVRELFINPRKRFRFILMVRRMCVFLHFVLHEQ